MSPEELEEKIRNNIPRQFATLEHMDASSRLVRLTEIAHRILETVQQLFGTVDVETLVQVAKKIYDSFRPQIPDIVEQLLWNFIEQAIRRMFTQQVLPVPQIQN